MAREGIEGGFVLPPGFKYKQKYICLWALPNGAILSDGQGNYFCAESFKENDSSVEMRMRQSVRNMGIEGGFPLWKPGRKVSESEHDDQMERLLDGKIPDPEEEYLDQIEQEYLNKKNGS